MKTRIFRPRPEIQKGNRPRFKRFIVIWGVVTIRSAAQGLGRCAGFGNPLYVLMFWHFCFSHLCRFLENGYINSEIDIKTRISRPRPEFQKIYRSRFKRFKLLTELGTTFSVARGTGRRAGCDNPLYILLYIYISYISYECSYVMHMRAFLYGERRNKTVGTNPWV